MYKVLHSSLVYNTTHDQYCIDVFSSLLLKRKGLEYPNNFSPPTCVSASEGTAEAGLLGCGYAARKRNISSLTFAKEERKSEVDKDEYIEKTK